MSLEKIVEEAMAGRPLEMKEAFEAEIQKRIQEALEARFTEMMEAKAEDDEDEDEDDDEEDEDDEDMKESFNLDEEALDFIDSMLDEGHDIDDIIDSIVEQELDEGSIKGSGTDRKAQLKKAYRDGEQKTRDFYKNKITKAPRTSDKGIKKAFQGGANAGDGSPTAKGGARSKPQDKLKGTEHDQSNVSPTSKSFRSTHRSKMYNIKTNKPKLPK